MLPTSSGCSQCQTWGGKPSSATTFGSGNNSQSLWVELNRNRNFVQESKFLFLSEDYRNSGYKCQEKSRKNIFFLYIYSESLKWKWKWKDILPAFFLTVETGMPEFPVVLRRKQEFRFLHKVSVPVPLNSKFLALFSNAVYWALWCSIMSHQRFYVEWIWI